MSNAGNGQPGVESPDANRADQARFFTFDRFSAIISY